MNAIKILASVAMAAAVSWFAGNAFAADTDCATSNGKATCIPAVPLSDWSYTLCDDTAPNMGRVRVWCEVRGGTWDVNTTTCIGTLPPITAANSPSLAQAFETQIHGASCGSTATAPGCSDVHCECDPVTIGGVLAAESSILDFSGKTLDSSQQCTGSWTENVISRKLRTVGCPAGSLVSGSGATLKCVQPEPCEECDGRRSTSNAPANFDVGNPVNVASGAKRQREVDYVATAPGAASFVRYYNSSGFYDVSSREPLNTDYWRHSYSSRVVPHTGNAYVMAAVVHANGTARLFNTSGNEVKNFDGAAHHLVKLTDGSGNVTGWTLTTPNSDVEAYDAQGRLTTITTRSGFVTTLGYNGSGQLTTVTDAYGRALTLTYDTSGQLETMTDPGGGVVTYAYDTLGRLSTATYPDTKVRTYVYEDTRWKFSLTGIIDERGARLSTYGYDSFGRANLTEHSGSDKRFDLVFTDFSTTASVVATDAFGTSHTYWFDKAGGRLRLNSHFYTGLGTEYRTYDANGNLASLKDRRNTMTTYTNDLTRNLETSRTEASGTSLARTITTTWHSTFRLPASITEPSGVSGVNLVTEFTYDTAGNLTKKKLTAGAKVREWNYTVNSRGQVLTIDGPRTDVTDVTTFTYYGDSDTCTGCRGNVNTVTNAASQVTTFVYDTNGRPSTITDPNGVATTLTYKPRGWLASRSAGGETTTYDYDFTGNLSKVTLPDGSWIGYQYDAANGLIAVEDSLGNSIEYELDVMGNRVAEYVFDPQGEIGRTMQRVYDGVNRLQTELGAAGQATTYGFDSNNNVLTVTDPLFRVTTNTYDVLNRLTNVNDPAAGNTTFTYDTKDRLATVKDPKLTATTTYTYDGLGNLLTQASPDTGTTTFTYDNAGNVATQVDARSVSTAYTYDVLNRVTAATVTDGTVTYEYDNLTTGGSYAKGRLTKITDPSGNTTYVYDNLGRVTSKTQTVTASPSNKVFTTGYAYSSGRQTGTTYPSGRVVGYGYNAQGQLTSITVDGSTTVLSGGEYAPFGPIRKWTWGNGQVMDRTFDQDGRLAAYTLGPSTATYADLSQVFGYDSLNRLTSANLAAGQTQSFTYDANSNRTNATINAASTTYTYPSTSHKLTSLSGATTRSFTYDNAGNTTVTAGVTYVYDGRGRMKQAGSATYLVNGLGQRVRKNTGADTYFAYDEAGRLIGEYDSAGAAIQETVWLGDLPVAVVKPASPSGFTVYNIWPDHLGTPRLITDTSNQARWEWGHNDPFGNNAPNENPASLGTFSYNLRFPGQYFDAETGKHYNYFRSLDPSIGRYLTSDPIGLAGGINTYGYVGGNPMVASDPSGLFFQSFGVRAILGLAAAMGGASSVQKPAGLSGRLESLWDRVCAGASDPCASLRLEIENTLTKLKTLQNNLLVDKFHLFANAFSTPNKVVTGVGSTWLGHVSDYELHRQKLEGLVALAKRIPCTYSPEADVWVNMRPPNMPLPK